MNSEIIAKLIEECRQTHKGCFLSDLEGKVLALAYRMDQELFPNMHCLRFILPTAIIATICNEGVDERITTFTLVECTLDKDGCAHNVTMSSQNENVELSVFLPALKVVFNTINSNDFKQQLKIWMRPK